MEIHDNNTVARVKSRLSQVLDRATYFLIPRVEFIHFRLVKVEVKSNGVGAVSGESRRELGS